MKELQKDDIASILEVLMYGDHVWSFGKEILRTWHNPNYLLGHSLFKEALDIDASKYLLELSRKRPEFGILLEARLVNVKGVTWDSSESFVIDSLSGNINYEVGGNDYPLTIKLNDNITSIKEHSIFINDDSQRIDIYMPANLKEIEFEGIYVEGGFDGDSICLHWKKNTGENVKIDSAEIKFYNDTYTSISYVKEDYKKDVNWTRHNHWQIM